MNEVPKISKTDSSFTKKWKSYAVWDDSQISGFFGQYRFLSNFEPSPIYNHDFIFPTVEHAYQFAKLEIPKNEWTVYFNKWNDEADRVSKMTAREVKNWGQKVSLRPDWEEVKYDIMLSCIFMKFFLHKELRKQLFYTGDRELIELNHWGDLYWGKDFKTFSGENNLGKILMKIREVFK